VPYHRLERSAIAAAHGAGGGKGTRAVASYDEDATSMGVEAARLARRSLTDADGPAGRIDQLWFSTTAPSYTDKTNATTIHAALRLDRDTAAFDANGSVRSAVGALRAALDGRGTALVVAGDLRTGLPNSADEREGGDGAAALVIGDDGIEGSPGPVIAEHLGTTSLSEEFVDRWRVPGEVRSRQWEERFGETRYVPLGTEAFKAALGELALGAEDIATVIVTGTHARAVRQVTKKVGEGVGAVADDLTADLGNAGAAHAALVLTDVLEQAEPGQLIALVVLADGADVLLFRTTDAITSFRPARSVRRQIDAGRSGLPYIKFLSWKGVLTVQPPNRPEPARASSSAAARNQDWKYGFVGSQDNDSGALHVPPARVSYTNGHLDDMAPRALADTQGTVVTSTVDRLAYSPSPPIVFAVIDFDAPDGGEARSGGRLPLELTDVDATDVKIGDRVEMTFRRLNQSDGIHNYFWKGKPVLADVPAGNGDAR
jgi:3-hydroxy-3-methylglutaryl CoA synthase/uncharacterized OB-fold protein